jgi:hypothetical protein
MKLYIREYMHSSVYSVNVGTQKQNPGSKNRSLVREVFKISLHKGKIIATIICPAFDEISYLGHNSFVLIPCFYEPDKKY